MVTVSCPGSINIMGEHALIRAGKGIRLAINRCVSVNLQKISGSDLQIQSRLGYFKGSFQELLSENNMTFLAACLEHFNRKQGLAIKIDDDLPSDVGLGSSAALVVALSKALVKINQEDFDKKNMFSKIKNIIQAAQKGVGSGIDAAASLYGGMVVYDPLNNNIENLPLPPEICVLYSGKKTPTTEVVRFVENQNPSQTLFTDMNAATDRAAQCAREQDWKSFGTAMNTYQEYMIGLNLNTPELDQLCGLLMQNDEIYGAKIAGAGLGDCVIGIGKEGVSQQYREHAGYIAASAFGMHDYD